MSIKESFKEGLSFHYRSFHSDVNFLKMIFRERPMFPLMVMFVLRKATKKPKTEPSSAS